MKRAEILRQIQEIFREVLDNKDLLLKEELTTTDIEDWDSLTHIQIVVDMERKFSIKFSAKEILSWKNIGEIIDCIESK